MLNEELVQENLDDKRENFEKFPKYRKCLRCGRKLIDPERIALGYGKVCEKRVNRDVRKFRLFDKKSDK